MKLNIKFILLLLFGIFSVISFASSCVEYGDFCSDFNDCDRLNVLENCGCN